MVLRSLMHPGQPSALSTGTAVGTLTAYGAFVAVIATVITSRAVTA